MASKDLENIQRTADVYIASQTFLVAMSQLSGQPSYANDAAAKAGGVELNMPYRNGSLIMVRVA